MEFQETDQKSRRQRRRAKENSLFGSTADQVVRKLQATAEGFSRDYNARLAGMYSRDDCKRMKADYTKKLQAAAADLFYTAKLKAMTDLSEFESKHEAEAEKVRPDQIQRDRMQTKILAMSTKEIQAQAAHYIKTGKTIDGGAPFEADSLDILTAHCRMRELDSLADEIRRFDSEVHHTHEPWKRADEYDALCEAMENIDLVRGHFEQGGKVYMNPAYDRVDQSTVDRLFPDMPENA